MQALQRLDAMQPETEEAAEQRQFTAADGGVEVQLNDISYRYPSQPAAVFSGFSHRFAGPGWHWICGASGRGKSTLIALLAGQLQVNSGRIELALAGPGQVGLMPQRIDILRASLRDNLCLNHAHSDDELMAALRLVELEPWAQKLPQGLDTWLGDGEWQPSGGESKRLGLARLILQNPQLILLDEPAAGMDVLLAQRIFARLAEHWQDKLVIANTHDRGLILAGQQVLELDQL